MTVNSSKCRIAFSLLFAVLPFLASAQIFFKVEGKDLTTPSYLFGTHHLAPIAMLDSMPQVGETLSECIAVVGEIDMAKSQANPAVLMPYMMAPADSTLSKLYAPEEYERLNGEFRKWAGGLDLKMFDQMKPLVANMTVAMAMVIDDIPDYVPGEQLDAYFQTVALQSGKQVKALETVEQQGEYVFNALPIAEQAQTLAEVLDNPEKSRQAAIRLNESYFRHDIEGLLKETIAENEDPRFFEMLLLKRNADWLEKLPGILSEGPVFIAVGALHLAGDQGIVEGLRNLGYTVTPIQ